MRSRAKRCVAFGCSGALCLLLGTVVVPPTAQGAVPGQYGAPEWLPLRHDAAGGGVPVGCTYLSSDGLCDGHHRYWAIDFVGSTGSPVYATGSGLASNVTGGGYEGYGNVVMIDHGGHGKSLYAHLSEVLVDGQWVDQNTMIGRIGSSGGANTPHLHYEESGSSTFGSAGARDPGPMKACRGSQLVTFPQVWGSATWQGMPWGSGTVDSDGGSCDVTNVVADAIGATVATGVAALAPSTVAAAEQVVAADFNGDGYGDVGSRDIASGLFTLRQGPAFISQVSYPWAAGANYQAVAADFDGDRIGDIGLRETGSGTFYLKHGPAFADQVIYSWTGGSQLQALAGDFNADRVADIGLRDPATGLVTMKRGPAFDVQTTFQSPAGAEYQVVAADFNSDRMADIGVRNTGTGAFTVNLAPTFAGQTIHAWKPGAAYQAVAADFNNDGTADLGLKNPGSPVLDIKPGPTFGSEMSTPIDPRLDGLASLLGGLFAILAGRPA